MNVAKTAQKTTKTTIVRLFEESDLRCGHLGLSKIAKQHKIDLKPGEFLCFLNRSQTGVKILGPANVLIYLKSEEKIDLETIKLIPKLFRGSAFNFKSATELHLKKAA